MNTLQSQASPLRSHQNFYRPFYKVKQQTNRKNFDSPKQNPLLTTLEPLKTKKFIDEMEKTKFIHRGFYHQQLYYPNPEKSMSSSRWQYQTNNKIKSRSFASKLGHQSIEKERRTFMQNFQNKNEKKKELNLSFYNTKSKSKYYMDKFHDWKKLDERSSPTYQNMLQREFALKEIMDKVKKNERKFVKGY